MKQILGERLPELIIMIGPSGAGKSTKAKNLGLPVVSTDTIRQNLFGLDEAGEKINAKAYTRGGFSDTFAAAKFVVEGYLRAGQSVVYDATNLTKTDRLQFLRWLELLDNTPREERTQANITYFLVDRPIEVKIGSYMARIKGNELVYQTSIDIIERHHQKMQAHVHDALAGDGIPGVTVWDRRS